MAGMMVDLKADKKGDLMDLMLAAPMVVLLERLRAG